MLAPLISMNCLMRETTTPRSKNRTARNRRRTRDGSQNRLLGVVGLVAVPALMLGLGGYGLHRYMQIEQIDARFCYDRVDQAQTAVFVDYSVNENLSGAQQRDLVTALERAYAQTPANGRIMLFTTARDTTGSIARPVFEICRPAPTAQAQTAIGAPTKTTPNLRYVAEQAEARFRAEITRILDDTQSAAKAAQESPILEQVQAISRYPGFLGSERAFVWLSDGIQNSEIARFGAVKGDMPGVAAFLQRPDYDVIAPDSLAGMSVTLLLVESVALPQPGLEFVTHDEMRRWWPEFFRANGAAHVRLERLRRVDGT